MKYLGNFAEDAVVRFAFALSNSSGARTSFSASLEEADIPIFKDGSAMTLDASTITVTAEPGSRTGLYIVAVNMANDADFTIGSDYIAVLYPSDETVDGQLVTAILAQWSCENRFDEVDVVQVGGATQNLPTATDLATVDANVDAILLDTGTDGVKVDMAQTLPGTPTADTVGDALKQATREEAPKRATALADIPFYMVDSTDHVTPETSLTVTAEVSKDGGAFAAAAGSVTEIGSGVYHFDATAADMTADVVVFKFTATGADPQVIAISTVD